MNLRKLLFIIFTVAALFSLVACKKDDTPTETPEQTVYCTVSFDFMGFEPQTVKKGTCAALPEDIPHKDGYIFIGWKKGERLFSFSTPINEDTILTPSFKAVDYTIEYYDGEKSLTLSPNTYNIEGGVPTLPTPSAKAHYEFAGWYTDAEFKNRITSIANGYFGEIKLYAKYEPVAYTVTYVLDGGENDDGNPESFTISDEFVLSGAKKLGYTFIGWYTDETFAEGTEVRSSSDISLSDVTLYARFEIDTYGITYELDGGENDDGNPESFTISDEFVLSGAKKLGYTFIGWYTDETFAEGTEVRSSSDISLSNVTLYARYEIDTYGITYELDGGVNGEGNPDLYTVLDSITLADAVKVGYTFRGWFTDPSFSDEFAVSSIEGRVGDITLYAKFTPELMNITYVLGDGENDDGNPDTYFLGDTTVLLDASQYGYEFAGWYTDEDFNYNSRVYSVSELTGNVTLYAKFNIKHYTITYHLLGGTNDSRNPVSYTVLDSSFVFAVPTRSGYKFAGWYTNATYTQQISTLNAKADNLDLYAKWEKNSSGGIVTPEDTFN